MKNTIARPLPVSVVTFVPTWHAAAVRGIATAVLGAGVARTNDPVGAGVAATYKHTTRQVASTASSPPV